MTVRNLADDTALAGPSCPSCRTSDVMRARTAHEQGTSFHSLSTGTVGVGTGGIGLAKSSTTGESKSLTALKMAPPPGAFGLGRFASVLIALLIMMVAGMILSGAGPVGVLIGVGLGVWFGVWSFKGIATQEAAYPSVLAAYERRWLCSRCGTVGDQAEFGFADPERGEGDR